MKIDYHLPGAAWRAATQGITSTANAIWFIAKLSCERVSISRLLV